MNNPVRILFATQTGNAEYIATQAAKDLAEAGVPAEASSMADATVDQLRDESRLILVASTWGEGEPPDDCVDFYEALEEAQGIDLSHIQYAVMALGDSSYEDFCQFGKDLDAHLERLGAIRLRPRLDCDLDEDEKYPGWIRDLAVLLAARAEIKVG